MIKTGSLYLSVFLLFSEITATNSAITIRSAQQYEKIASSNTPLVTLYSASWCGPCKIMKPRIMQEAHKSPGITFCIIDIDAKPLQKLCSSIRTIPKITFRSQGALVAEHLGVLSTAELHTKCLELQKKNQGPLKK